MNLIFHHNFLSTFMYLRPLSSFPMAERSKRHPQVVTCEDIQRDITLIQFWPKDNILILTIDIYMHCFHSPIQNEDFFSIGESIPNQMSHQSEHFNGVFLHIQNNSLKYNDSVTINISLLSIQRSN